MELILNKQIVENLDNIYKLSLQMVLSLDSKRDKIFNFEVDLNHFKKFNTLTINKHYFDFCDEIRYKVTTLCGKTKVYRFKNKNNAVFKNPNQTQQTFPNYIRTKIKENFIDTKANQNLIFSNIKERINYVNSQLDYTIKGNKNLIYYVVYGNKDYVSLLNLSILSLTKHSDVDCDLLIITDEETKSTLESFPVIKELMTNANTSKNIKFYITSHCTDGVEASMQKLEVFNFVDIFNYNKVLYLDCDILVKNNISNIFNKEIEPNKFYTAHNTHLSYESFLTPQHGFECLSHNFVKKMEQTNQMPFNAGQFMFAPTVAMKQHFNNIKWMISEWTGEYFFEQCFMNYYFCEAQMTDLSVLQEHTKFILTIENSNIDLKENNTTLLHFIAPPLNGKYKLNHI